MSSENNQDWQEWSSVNSDSSNEWGTPREIYGPFGNIFDGFDLDPCSGAEPQPIGETRYTKEDDGLSQEWFGDVWVNPPYSDPGSWLKKAVSEHNQDNTDRILMLLPARTNTNYFTKYVEQADLLCFVDHKVKFLKDGKKAPDYLPSPVSFVYFGEVDDDIKETLNEFGMVFNIDNDMVRLSDFSDK